MNKEYDLSLDDYDEDEDYSGDLPVYEDEYDSVPTDNEENIDEATDNIGETVNPLSEEEKEKERKKLRLYKWLEEQSTEYRDVFFKMIQLDAIMEMFEALKNMKKTPGDVWKNVITKLKNSATLPVSSEEKKKFDFKKFIEILLPILGALAATLIALKDAEGEEIESARRLNKYKPDDEMTREEKIEAKNKAIIKEEQEESLRKSIVLSLAESKQNGFSL